MLMVLISLWLTDIRNIFHYAGRIPILWPVLGGAVNSDCCPKKNDHIMEYNRFQQGPRINQIESG